VRGPARRGASARGPRPRPAETRAAAGQAHRRPALTGHAGDDGTRGAGRAPPRAPRPARARVEQGAAGRGHPHQARGPALLCARRPSAPPGTPGGRGPAPPSSPRGQAHVRTVRAHTRPAWPGLRGAGEAGPRAGHVRPAPRAPTGLGPRRTAGGPGGTPQTHHRTKTAGERKSTTGSDGMCGGWAYVAGHRSPRRPLSATQKTCIWGSQQHECATPIPSTKNRECAATLVRKELGQIWLSVLTLRRGDTHDRESLRPSNRGCQASSPEYRPCSLFRRYATHPIRVTSAPMAY
jgi:hypothetical protein